MNWDCEMVKDSEGSGVPEKESECVFLDLVSVISSEIVAVGSVYDSDSVGINDAVSEGVLREGDSVGGSVSVGVG